MKSKPQFIKHKLIGDDIYRVTFRVVAINTQWNIYSCGTAVSICGNAVITARHVIDDFIEQYGYTKIGNDVVANFDIWLVQITNDKDLYAIWKCNSFYFCPYSDIAVLYTFPYNEKAFELRRHIQCGMILTPPKVGEKVIGFGYKGLLDNGSITNIDDLGTRHYLINDEPHTTIGNVTEVYNTQNNPSKSKSPCFITNFRIEGGMSGGPVFRENGQLCGIHSTSYPKWSEDEPEVSFICSLWPLMGTKLTIPRTGYCSNESYYMLELAKNGLINAESWEKITINPQIDEITLKM